MFSLMYFFFPVGLYMRLARGRQSSENDYCLLKRLDGTDARKSACKQGASEAERVEGRWAAFVPCPVSGVPVYTIASVRRCCLATLTCTQCLS